MQDNKQQLELDMEQWTGSKLGKDYVKAVYCHPAYLTYVQNTSCKMPGWMKHKLESRLPGETSTSTHYYNAVFKSHVSKVMLKILYTRLQQYVNHKLSDVQAVFRKGRGIRDQIAKIRWIMEKAREFQKNIYFCFIDNAKDFVWITGNCGKL